MYHSIHVIKYYSQHLRTLRKYFHNEIPHLYIIILISFVNSTLEKYFFFHINTCTYNFLHSKVNTTFLLCTISPQCVPLYLIGSVTFFPKRQFSPRHFSPDNFPHDIFPHRQISPQDIFPHDVFPHKFFPNS